MEEYDFRSGDFHAPTVTLQGTGLKFNRACVDLLGAPSAVKIGIDRERGRLAVKPMTEEDKKNGIFGYPFSPDGRKDKQVKVESVWLKKEVEKIAGRKPPRGCPLFFAFFDDEKKALVVCLI